MNFLHKTQLLLAFRRRACDDRGQDWQALHQRDRAWFAQQPPAPRWTLLQRWLADHDGSAVLPVHYLGWIASPLGMIIGFGLMAGLLQFSTPLRINLWWWLLLAVWLPGFFWLLGLLLTQRGSMPWLRALSARQLEDANEAPSTLLRLSSSVLAQQFGLWFSLGLLLSFAAYLLLTDLAFGWSTTLDITAGWVHQATGLLATPWQSLWPAAVPSLELVEQTRVFRTALPDAVVDARQWWPFLLMNLLVYNLAPRLLSYLWFRYRLHAAQLRLFSQDAAIGGWWQRINSEFVEHSAEPVGQADVAAAGTAAQAPGHNWPAVSRILYWGLWPQQLLSDVRAGLPEQLQRLPVDAAPAALMDGEILLLCKGWEPPTGALVDYCQGVPRDAVKLLLWPVSLPGMSVQRADELRRSWDMAAPTLPDNCELFEPPHE